MSCDSLAKNRMIFGKSVVLVPYREIHVPKYNQWMKDPNLQYLTGSEPLTLQEEYDMMNGWLSDPNKCTFIVLDKQLFQTNDSQIEAMIGDINIFIDVYDIETKSAEIEIMIAEEAHRGLGKGKEAVLMMMWFAVEVIGIKRFVAKIKYNNIGSQNMFANIGFVQHSRSDLFQEVTSHLEVTDQWLQRVKPLVEGMSYRLL